MKISKKRSLKWVLSIFVLIYIFNVIRTAISLFCNKAFQPEALKKGIKMAENKYESHFIRVLVFGDVHIMKYLQEDVLNANNKDTYIHKNIHFSFKPIIEQRSFLWHFQVVVLMGNARSKSNIQRLKAQLDFIKNSMESMRRGRLNADESHKAGGKTRGDLVRVGLLMVGSEDCQNQWLTSYLSSQGGFVDFVFVTYNALETYKFPNVYRWPLGVAKYRSFPALESVVRNVENRLHLCNFIGTAYENSSRSRLVDDLRLYEAQHGESLCHLRARLSWPVEEDIQSAASYRRVLNQSDFTLCPVGANEESYRIYEALTYGSIPIIEEASMSDQENFESSNFCHQNKELYGEKEIKNNVYEINLNTKQKKITNFKNLLEKNCSLFFHSESKDISCDGRQYHDSNHKIFKHFKAPVLFTKKLSFELILMLKNYVKGKEIKIWRLKLIDWYSKFLVNMSDLFVKVISDSVSHF